MNPAKHCELCDNRVFDMTTGTTCGLTGQRPDFKEKCPDIRFEVNYEEIIKEINVEHHLVERTRNLSIANFIVFLALGILIIVAGYLIGSYAMDKGVISTVPLIIMGVGVTVLPLAFGPLNKYKQESSVARKKKSDLDNLLAKYNIAYEMDIIVNKDVHGNLDVDAKVNFTRKHYR